MRVTNCTDSVLGLEGKRMRTLGSLVLISVITACFYTAWHDGILAYYLVDEREYWAGALLALLVGALGLVFTIRRELRAKA